MISVRSMSDPGCSAARNCSKFSASRSPPTETLYAAARHGIVPISTTTNIPGKSIPPDYRGIPSLWITP